jgi:DNA-binding protein Fis
MKTSLPSQAAVIGDLIASRQTGDRVGLQRELESALYAVNRRLRFVQPLIATVGDEFQGVLGSVEEAVTASLWIRLHLAGVVGVRIGIGWGEIEVIDSERVPMAQDGPAWWRARSAIKEVERLERSNQAQDSLRTLVETGDRLQGLYNSAVVSRDQLLSRLDSEDAVIVETLLSGGTQAEAAALLGINKSSVSRRLQTHGLASLIRADRELNAEYQAEYHKERV